MENLRLSFNNERKQMLTYREQQLAKLEDAEFTLEQRHKHLMSDIIRVYSESLAAYESAHDDQMAALLLEEKVALAERSQKNQEVLVLHQEEAKELEDLVQKKQRIIQKTEEKMKTAKKLQVTAAQQQQKLKSSETENELLERDLTKAIDDVKQKTRKLRDKMTGGQLRVRTGLRDLTVQSDSAAKRLQAAINKGERVLRVGELCHKLNGVIAPLPCSTDDRKPGTHEDQAEETSAFPELHHLTRNINVAVLHCDAAKRDREHLRRENVQLRLLLRQRLDAMTVSDHALDGGPGLLSIHQAPTMRTPQSTGQRQTVIEAVHAIKNSL
ncbi:dynein regulatory complex subunit 2-like [Cynoglossus semilaevis]|nr:dynein regulatory complex subunit 2-like [Cynoglossus semilaevis]